MKIAVASGKGGTGKTTVASNLAHFLSQKEKVVLVDLDVEEPNSKLFLGGELVEELIASSMIPIWNRDKCKSCSVCQDACNFNAIIQLGPEIIVFPDLCHSCFACATLCPKKALEMKPSRIGEIKQYQSKQLFFVEGRLDIGKEQATPLIRQTIDYADGVAEQEKMIQIYDISPGTACPVVESLRDMDHVILVTEPTPFGLHDLKLSIDLLETLEKKFSVIINRDGIGNLEVEEYCLEKDIPIVARISNQRVIAEHYASGELLYPHIEEVRQALFQIKEQIIEAGVL